MPSQKKITKKESLGKVYKVTSPSGRIYVGSTSMSVENRWKHYKNCNCHEQTKLYNSLKKYGSENHIYEVIWEGDLELMLKMEHLLGMELNVLDKKKGLNLVLPGVEDLPRKVSDETRERIGKPARKAVVMYSETGERLMEFDSTRSAAKYLDRHPSSVSGACHTKVHKVAGYYFRYKSEFDKSILEIEKTIIKLQSIKVNQVCLKTLEVIKTWESTAEICRYIPHMDKNRIAATCKGLRPSYKGFKWEYAEDDEKEIICQIDMETNQLIKIWYEGGRAASRELGISESNLYAAIKGIRRKSCGGFIWKYYSDYLSSHPDLQEED